MATGQRFHSGSDIKAKFRRPTSHEPNRMLMRKNKGFFSFAFDSAHVKYGLGLREQRFPFPVHIFLFLSNTDYNTIGQRRGGDD